MVIVCIGRYFVDRCCGDCLFVDLSSDLEEAAPAMAAPATAAPPSQEAVGYAASLPKSGDDPLLLPTVLGPSGPQVHIRQMVSEGSVSNGSHFWIGISLDVAHISRHLSTLTLVDISRH